MGSFGSPQDIMTFSLLTFNDWTNANTSTNLDYRFKISQMRQWTSWYGGAVGFSVVGFKIELERYHVKYVLNYYAPSLIFVITSWTSFLVPPTIVPGRMSLLITTLLVLVNFYGTVIENQPPSQEPTAIVIWTICCAMFVFGALLAYAVLLYKLYKMKSQTRRYKKKPQRGQDEDDEKSPDEKDLAVYDKFFLVTFPLLFCLFNLIYWPTVIMQEPVDYHPVCH